jgi:hypothetical protein
MKAQQVATSRLRIRMQTYRDCPCEITRAITDWHGRDGSNYLMLKIDAHSVE